MDRSELLVRYGFIRNSKKGNYYYDKEKNWYEPVSGYKLDIRDAYEEETELVPHSYTKTGFPATIKTFRLMMEMHDLSLEEPYFWVLDTLKGMFPIIEKLEDSFAAAENSAFFGVTQQRLGAQQDKVSQYLATMGKMIKEVFQMVRELRIIDERLGYYNEAQSQFHKPISDRGRSAEITLKGLFVDLVQGGGKSAASVYGMARELEFVTLPDLFFDAPPFKDQHELENHVKSMEENFNKNVLRVLLRHLRQFMEWKKRTHQEHENRRRFQLQYLWQHYDIIKMYLNWIKPYLRHVSRLTMKEKRLESADIVSAFEGSLLDIEFIARKEKDGANGCILVTFNYRTRPELKVVQEGYQRGPVHIGKMEMTIRGYTWTDKQLENYKNLKRKEELMLLGNISSSVQSAMESLGVELEKYLMEARGELDKKKEAKQEEKKDKRSLMEQFLGDFYTVNKVKVTTKSKKELEKMSVVQKKALKGFDGYVSAMCWNTFHFFKKAHRMITW